MANLTRNVARRIAGLESIASQASTDFGLYGLRVRSGIDLGPWPAPPQGEPHVTVVEEPPAPPTYDGAPYTARTTFGEQEVRLEIGGVASYTATGGSCIRVAPEPGAKPEDLRQYLTGATFGLILHQRGIYPLHASCVGIRGIGVAFAAPSGSGKSTLVGALLRRGATFISDDLCVMTPVKSGSARVWRGAARLKLDGTGMVGIDDARAALEPAGGNRGKYHVPVSARRARRASIPLSRVYLLGFGDGDVRLERLEGLDAISALLDETYLLAYAVEMGLSPQIFKKVAELSRTLTVSRLIRPHGFEHLEAVLDLIEDDVRTAAHKAQPESE